jgi:hypothetical protein
MLIAPVENRSDDLIPNPDQHQADQFGQHMGVMHFMTGRPGEFLIVLGTGLKELGQRMRPKHLPTKQRRLWSQSPHH